MFLKYAQALGQALLTIIDREATYERRPSRPTSEEARFRDGFILLQAIFAWPRIRGSHVH
jgi:hypothetical protein